MMNIPGKFCLDCDARGGKREFRVSAKCKVPAVLGRGWWNIYRKVTQNTRKSMAEWNRVLDIKIWRSLVQIFHPNVI